MPGEPKLPNPFETGYTPQSEKPNFSGDENETQIFTEVIDPEKAGSSERPKDFETQKLPLSGDVKMGLNWTQGKAYEQQLAAQRQKLEAAFIGGEDPKKEQLDSGRVIREAVKEAQEAIVFSREQMISKIEEINLQYSNSEQREEALTKLIVSRAIESGIPPGIAMQLSDEGKRRVVLGPLGKKGGMGAELYEVMDVNFPDRPEVMKLIKPTPGNAEEMIRFQGEAIAAAQVQTPYAVRVRNGNFDDIQEGLFYIMEKAEGRDTEEMIQENPNGLPQADVLQIANHISQGLEAVHQQGILHRDLKPANFFGHEDQVGDEVQMIYKLGDFGIAKGGGAVDLDEENAVIGTPLYMSPEMAIGAPEFDKRSDVYQLGQSLYKLISGKSAYEHARGNSMYLVSEIAQGNAKSLKELLQEEGRTDVSPELVGLIEWSMQYNAEDRPTAKQFTQEIQSIIAGRPPSSELLLFMQQSGIEEAPPPPPQKKGLFSRWFGS